MTWLYSIMLAGLMFTSGTDSAVVSKQNLQSLKFQNSEKISAVKKDETEKFEQTYPLDANGTVSVSNINGSITIEAWDNPQVKLEVVKVADSRESLQNVEVKIDARQNNFRVETDYDHGGNNRNDWKNGRKLEVSFHLIVPRTAVLNEIETVNGSVIVSDFTNYTKVSAVNGEVKATNLRGSASLSTVNGTVEADFQSFDAVKQISLETVNGKVNLTVPSDMNATLKADTLNGEIINDFGLPVRKNQYVGKDLYGKIGSGEVQIKMSSVNGGLSVKRRNDGKNLNPAVNLLQKGKSGKEDEDRDDENGNDAAFDSAQINAEVAKSVADSQKEIAKAQKESAKAMKDAQKQIGKISGDALKQATEYLNSEDFKDQMKAAAEVQKEVFANNGKFNLASSSDASLIEKKSENFTVKGTPKVTINAKGCAVSVRGWDKSEVSYAVKRFSKNRSQTPLNAVANHTDSSVNIEVKGNGQNVNNDYSDETNAVRLEVFVPKKADLKIITNGEIRLEGVTGDLDLNGADESINVRDSGGNLHIVSDDGIVRVVGFKGELNSKMADGTTYLEGDFDKLSAVTDDGEIILTLPENADVNIESNLESIASNGIVLSSAENLKDSKIWKIGKGGANFRLFSEADGKITVRGKNTLNAGN